MTLNTELSIRYARGMADRARDLFEQLQKAEQIVALIGKSEDLHLDCKEWPLNDDSRAQNTLAKAACGLTNSDGGVLVIGMRARRSSIDDEEVDVIESVTPVMDATAARSRILDLIGQLVEPRIEGVQAEAISDKPGSKSGFVIVIVPKSDGPPHRSRKDWKFYQRIGSGTFPMEYFQIEERFGKRPAPKLQLHLEPLGIKGVN